ncbi:MAG: hypothetical protein EP318_18455 [Rhodobacteraceae bacterium]|nr:MAG: hypothetical protein EP318_18455 [Paracoccaceae bacterium]
MNTLDPSPDRAIRKPDFRARLARIGWVFAAIGFFAILLPAVATLAAELLVAWMLVLWGAVGLWFAWEMRPETEWRHALGAFGITLLLGLVFGLFPRIGIVTMTILMVIVFLMEGVVSILLGLRLSGQVRSWGWMVFSGLGSLVIGLVILIGWPGTAAWTLGLLLGVNFLTTGLSLVMFGRAAGDKG